MVGLEGVHCTGVPSLCTIQVVNCTCLFCVYQAYVQYKLLIIKIKQIYYSFGIAPVSSNTNKVLAEIIV